MHNELELDIAPAVCGALAALAACASEPADETGARPAMLLAACARPTQFAEIVDDGPRTSFRSTTDSTTVDWLTIGISMSLQLQTVPARMTALLEQLGQLDLGLPIDPLSHSLQAATRARRAGASDELVLAALCHAVGMTLSVENYGELSAAMLRGYVSDPIYFIVRHQEEYLPARPSGAVDPALRARHANASWHAAALRFADEWLAPAYERSYPAQSLSDFQSLLTATFAAPVPDPYITRFDCFTAQGTP